MGKRVLDGQIDVEAQKPDQGSLLSPIFSKPVTTVAVWGPAGAPGKSTLALNLADAFAKQGKRTLLIDADLVAPSLALMIGAAELGSGISVACRLAREAKLDDQELRRISLQIDSGGSPFTLLPGISGASRWPEITPSALEAVLRVAAIGFDIAVIDLASSLEPALNTPAAAVSRNELTRHMVANADHLLAVSLADAIGVHRMLRQILDVQKLRTDGVVHLAINRVRETVSSGNIEKQLIETFASLVKISPAYFLPNDPSATDSAVKSGVTVRLAKRRSLLARSIQQLADDLQV